MLCLKFASTTCKALFYRNSGAVAHLRKRGVVTGCFCTQSEDMDVENAMASNQLSPQRRSTCTAKYARNVAIFTLVYVRQYSCLTSKTNTKAPFVSGFSQDFIHRDIQNFLDGQLKLLSFSVLGLKPNTGHKYILIYFFLNNQTDALIVPILFCYKILYVSGIYSAHRQEFSTVHSALVSFM